MVEDRDVVYCKNVEAWENFVKGEREINLEENAKYTRKIYIDGGGDHFKICGNLIAEKLKPNSPNNSKKQKNRHKKDSVKTTYLLMVVEKIPETPENVKKIMDLLDLGPINFEDCLASDLKLINMIVGIQGHGSTCPCPFCEWNKNNGINGKARMRTFGRIR